MDTTIVSPSPSATSAAREMSHTLCALASQVHGRCILTPPRHRAILRAGQDISGVIHVKPAPMPGTSRLP